MKTYIQSRFRQLVPLSKEHEDGMIFINRIRAGLDKKVAVDRLGRYICWYWKNHIRPHFFLEERILLPYIPASNFFGKRLQEEHDEITELIIAIDDDPQKESMNSFCKLIEAHIQFEEEHLYSYLERQLGKNQLDAIYRVLMNHPVNNEAWHDEYWEH